MKRIALLLVFAAGCSSNPTSPSSTNPPVVPVTALPTTPPVVTTPTTPAPTTPVTPPIAAPNPLLSDPLYSLDFYRDFAQGNFEHQTIYPLSRLSRAPMIFLNTVDNRGIAIDATTLDTVAAGFVNVAGIWSGRSFGLSGIERGIGTREQQPGWLTVKWSADANGLCGASNHGQDGGVITFYYRQRCGCAGSAISPAIAKHELGHAFGFWHTRSRNDVMTGESITSCDMEPSAREQFHARVAYSQPIGSLEPR